MIHTAAHSAPDDLFPKDGGMVVIYDGECPLCSTYVRAIRLRETIGSLELLDARADDRQTRILQQMGYDLNEGMVVLYNGAIYHGADAVHIISLLSGRSGAMNEVLRRVMSNRSIARFSYPFLRAGRNCLLRLKGVEQLASLQ